MRTASEGRQKMISGSNDRDSWFRTIPREMMIGEKLHLAMQLTENEIMRGAGCPVAANIAIRLHNIDFYDSYNAIKKCLQPGLGAYGKV